MPLLSGQKFLKMLLLDAQSASATATSVRRLRRELQLIQQSPNSQVAVKPSSSSLLEWHFALHSLPEDTPYSSGCYHGRLLFPANYPHAPPTVVMVTPSGRLEVGCRLCFAEFARKGGKMDADVGCFFVQCGKQTKDRHVFCSCHSLPSCAAVPSPFRKGAMCLARCRGDSDCATQCFAEYGCPRPLDAWLNCTVEKEQCVSVPAGTYDIWMHDECWYLGQEVRPGLSSFVQLKRPVPLLQRFGTVRGVRATGGNLRAKIRIF
eukprot:Skav234163  [mRNA]  locus=scaffold572:98094:120197:+ [translate_table: standard]